MLKIGHLLEFHFSIFQFDQSLRLEILILGGLFLERFEIVLGLWLIVCGLVWESFVESFGSRTHKDLSCKNIRFPLDR